MNYQSLQRSAVFAACWAVVSSASAMNLLEAYKAAQVRDSTILASRATAVAGRERLPQAASQFMPSLSASFARTNNQLISTSTNILGVEQTTQSDYPSSNQTLSIRQPMFRPQLTAQHRQAQAQVDDAEAVLALDEQNLALRVGGAYFEALLTKEQLDLVLTQKAFYTKQLDAAKKALSAGAGTRTDIDDAQARLDMNLAQELEARQNVSFTLRQMQTLVAEPVESLASLAVERLVLAPLEPAALDDWIAKAELNSPQMKSLRAQLESARAEVAKAKAGHYPTLDAVAQVARSNSESVTSTSSGYSNNTIGLQLSIPIYSGGYVNSAVRQASALEVRANEALEAGRRDLGIRVYREFRGVTEGAPKILAYEQALRSADQLVLSNQKSFQAGSRTAIDILNAEQQRTMVLRDLAQARFIYLLSKLRLLALVGEAGESAIEEMNVLFK